jgi:methanethiol S-methyltransferase
MNYLLIIFLWGSYFILHSYLISIRFTDLMMRLLKSYYAFYRLFYVIISIVLLLPVLNYTNALKSEVIITYTQPWLSIRYFCMLASLIIFLKAFIFDYDVLSFFGIRQISEFKTKKSLNQKDEIMQKGLLGLVRHPMYFAVLLYFWSQTFRLTDILVNSLITVYIIVGTILEEKKLILEFGDAYIKYQKEVPMLIPFTKSRKLKINRNKPNHEI